MRKKAALFKGVKCKVKVKFTDNLVINPRSECILQGKLSRSIPIGTQGVCESHIALLSKGLFLAKAIVACDLEHIIPIKILNPGNETILVQKKSIIATYRILDNSFDILSCFHVQPKAKSVINSIEEDALSRMDVFPEQLSSSPTEDDPFFEYVQEKPTQVRFISNGKIEKVFPATPSVLDDQLYDGDTEDIYDDQTQTSKHFKRVTEREIKQSCGIKQTLATNIEKNCNGMLLSFTHIVILQLHWRLHLVVNRLYI
ncbi:hypothetical protein LOTGIDRAFT_163750 [Lottia gigantea]|uniref:Uncharacterized protein n=1 Tax=Lottia gigantea TaxID=225164 RepID=V4AC61_LOTGI|nr:hypothetical protein LOTGIDRAFT_163750 [Lottia gigantea]ESO90866.1 hypothetical protein LOTGIDRAFT_163750 [Lottia gigantea]